MLSAHTCVRPHRAGQHRIIGDHARQATKGVRGDTCDVMHSSTCGSHTWKHSKAGTSMGHILQKRPEVVFAQRPLMQPARRTCCRKRTAHPFRRSRVCAPIHHPPPASWHESKSRQHTSSRLVCESLAHTPTVSSGCGPVQHTHLHLCQAAFLLQLFGRQGNIHAASTAACSTQW